jgi:hypothetical protein
VTKTRPNQSGGRRRDCGRRIQKKDQAGAASLSDWEQLVYCVWVADYMMRNAGDFANAQDMYPSFQSDAKKLAARLGLVATRAAFSLSQRDLQKEYFNQFERICDELKSAETKVAPRGQR